MDQFDDDDPEEYERRLIAEIDEARATLEESRQMVADPLNSPVLVEDLATTDESNIRGDLDNLLRRVEALEDDPLQVLAARIAAITSPSELHELAQGLEALGTKLVEKAADVLARPLDTGMDRDS